MGKKASTLPTGQSQYQVVGRFVPNEKYKEDNAQCKVYRMNLFAKNKVVARSRFWYFMGRLCRVKKANGQIISVSQVHAEPARGGEPGGWGGGRGGASAGRAAAATGARAAAAAAAALEQQLRAAGPGSLRGATTACGQALTPRVRLVLLQIFEKTPERVKNFGIWFRYDSRTGTHNAYKEFREMALTDAINSCYQDMAGRSRAKSGAIQILKTAELKPEECKRPTVKQFHTSSIKFPLPHRIAKTPKEFKSTFKASKPTTFC